MARKMMLKNIDGFDEWLTMEYKNGKTMKELAKTCNCTPAAILGNMKRIGIESRTHGYHLIGKTMSEENKARLSKIHKGKTVSLETRKKQVNLFCAV